MITFSNLYRKGMFEYTENDEVIAKGNFTVNGNGVLSSIEVFYTNDIGVVNVFYDFNNDKPKYNISSEDLNNILIITNSIETIWNEVSESIKDSAEEQEEEQTEQMQSKKK